MAWRHGTQYGYTRKQCRCPDCKAAMRSKWNRALRPGRAEYDKSRCHKPEVKEANRERMAWERLWPKIDLWYKTQRPERSHCAYCKAILELPDLTIDRIIPGAQGGEYVDGNMALACGTCNSAKCGRRPDQWPHPRYYEPGCTSPEIDF